MPPAQLQSALEALLFSSDQPLPLTLLCESLDAPAERVLEAMRALEEEYAARGAGVQVREIAGGYLLSWFPYLFLGLAVAVAAIPLPAWAPAAPGRAPARARWA